MAKGPDETGKLEPLFDFTSRQILPWEVAGISEAATTGRVRMSYHATREAIDDGVDARDIMDIAARGKAKSKDLPGDSGRAPGINFEDQTPSGRTIRFKVGEADREYQVVTVYNLRRQ